AILLSDKKFAGADTIATAYTLSLAIKLISPDLVFCGRQTLVGDTAQTGPMLSVYSNFSIISNVMSIDNISDEITCTTRNFGLKTEKLPALLTIERINELRLPSIRSKVGEVEIWDAQFLGADVSKCGLEGSPTRVLKTFENTSGKRKCKFITLSELDDIIKENLRSDILKIDEKSLSDKKLSGVCIVGSEPAEYAESISDDYITIANEDDGEIVDFIKNNELNAVLFASDDESKEVAAKVAAKLDLGLCADCTKLETDGEQMIMYRPALSGSIVAKIISKTKPALATVRTVTDGSDIVVAAGYGVKDCIENVKKFAENYNAEFATSRKMVDNNILPYKMQVGLTGKTISPKIYIAIGVSGAVHHIVGMQRSGVIIAINPDKKAPIFEYADYGIVADFKDLYTE
ncbi:MAG: FAD-binding protein, partial [Clostridia bacterium]|nr:FAD-binding protein [Clostridia bacterium]